MDGISAAGTGADGTRGVVPPAGIGGAGLWVRDLAACVAFYRDAIGLEVILQSPSRSLLGAGGRGFLELLHRPDALRDDPREAGLFHIAFLLPRRADLADWITAATARRMRLDGASDHAVSEAIYLSDPEGNGVEMYADRPRSAWRYPRGKLRITTEQLDLDDLLGTRSESGWQGAPPATRIGHVHLRVGDAPRARDFWISDIGLDLVTEMPAAVFLSSGGYHHHVAANVWQSHGAGRRDARRAGLAFVQLELAAADAGVGGAASEDPWGTLIRRSSTGLV